MAGHSKWKNIRIRKGKQDAIRGKSFTKLAREIIVAAKSGGGDPAMNPRLRVAIEKAKAVSLPRENIDRAIKRGTGEVEGASYEEIVYEGTGPGGSAIVMEIYSENRNRTVAELRHAFVKNGGSMAENGAVMWQFKHTGEITIPREGIDEDALTLDALEAGAEDILSDEDSFTVQTEMASLHKVNDALLKAGYKTDEAGLNYVATNKVELSKDDTRKLLKLLDALEDLDDVQETYINVDISEEMYDED